MKNGQPTRIQDLTATFLGAAAAHPERAPQIYRRAAETFTGLASDRKNRAVARHLHEVAQEFAEAAQRPPTEEDFHDLLRETAQAYEEVGDDPLDLLARRREIHEVRSPTPRVSIAPASFTEDVTLGRAGIFTYAPSAAEIVNGIKQSDTLAFWQGQKAEAQAVTVDVGLISQNFPLPTVTPLPTDNARPYGIVEYGSDGNRTSVKFDVGFGVRFTVVGNYVSVMVGMDPPMSGSPAAQLSIGASLGLFAAPSQAPVFLTGYVDDLGVGASTGFIQRPQKAIQLGPIQTDATGGTTTLEFYHIGGGAAPLYRLEYPSGTLSASPIPLAGDVGFLKLINNTGGVANYRLPFQLSL